MTALLNRQLRPKLMMSMAQTIANNENIVMKEEENGQTAINGEANEQELFTITAKKWQNMIKTLLK